MTTNITVLSSGVQISAPSMGSTYFTGSVTIGGGSGGSSTLEGLTDTEITSVASGEVLAWNGTDWINRTLAEAGIAAASHTHDSSAITNFASSVNTLIGNASIGWAQLTSVPTTFTPASHTHGLADITDAGDLAALDTITVSLISDFPTLTKSKGIEIEDPGGAEDLTMFYTPVAITISGIAAVVVGSATPSVTYTIRHATDRSATGNEVVTGGSTVTNTTTGAIVTSFNDATIPANSWVWLETTAQSGTVDNLNVTLHFTEDA